MTFSARLFRLWLLLVVFGLWSGCAAVQHPDLPPLSVHVEPTLHSAWDWSSFGEQMRAAEVAGYDAYVIAQAGAQWLRDVGAEDVRSDVVLEHVYVLEGTEHGESARIRHRVVYAPQILRTSDREVLELHLLVRAGSRASRLQASWLHWFGAPPVLEALERALGPAPAAGFWMRWRASFRQAELRAFSVVGAEEAGGVESVSRPSQSACWTHHLRWAPLASEASERLSAEESLDCLPLFSAQWVEFWEDARVPLFGVRREAYFDAVLHFLHDAMVSSVGVVEEAEAVAEAQLWQRAPEEWVLSAGAWLGEVLQERCSDARWVSRRESVSDYPSLLAATGFRARPMSFVRARLQGEDLRGVSEYLADAAGGCRRLRLAH